MIEPAFLIVLDRASAEQRNAVHEAIKGHANGWWHQFADTWIVGGGVSAAEWRDLLRTHISSPAGVLVLRLPDAASASRNWAMFGPDAKIRAEWIHENYA
jgi:hypothetical protein